MGAGRGKSPVERAVARAVRLLKARERTRAELRERLSAAGFDGATVEAAMGRLGSLVDDARAAESHAHRLTARGPVGREHLVARLEDRGVGRALADEAATRSLPDTESRAAAEAAARAARRIPASLDAPTRWRRLLAALARAGFAEETAGEAARRVLGPPPDGE